MLTEVDTGGVYVAPIVVHGNAAVPPFALLRAVLGRAGLLRRTWHPAMLEPALYLSIVSLLVLYA